MIIAPIAAHLVTYSQTGAPIISFEVVVPLPPLSTMEIAGVRVLARLMTHDTEDFTPGKIRLVLAGAGDNVHWDVTRDHLRLSFSVPKADRALGFSLLTSILRKPIITDDTVLQAKNDVIQGRMTAWEAVLSAETGDPSRVRGTDVLRLYQTLIRPERLWIGVGGDVAQEGAAQSLGERFGDWMPEKPPRSYRPMAESEPAAPPHPPVTELSGPEFTSTSASFDAEVLACFALGVGKGASVFRVWREALGWSYLQECDIEGSPEGFQLSAWMAVESMPADRTKTAVEALKTDIAAWTEADRTRALAMAEAVMLRGLDLSPFCFTSRGHLGDSIADRTFLATYWKQKTGKEWDSRALLDGMSKVSLATLQEAATSFLNQAKPL